MGSVNLPSVGINLIFRNPPSPLLGPMGSLNLPPVDVQTLRMCDIDYILLIVRVPADITGAHQLNSIHGPIDHHYFHLNAYEFLVNMQPKNV